MATLAIIMVFGLVMLFSASYTTGYLRFGDSFHYIKSQLLCTVLGLGMMFLFSYFDHRFLRRMVKLGYVVCWCCSAAPSTAAAGGSALAA